MAKYSQLVKPNLKVTADAGLCLQFARKVYGAPAIYPSAWEAWKKAPGRHSGKHPSNVSVPVWFSHYGTYGSPPKYANWGHVVAYVPGKGYLSSPGSKHGSMWFKTIGQVEKYFNCKYAGWSEGINQVRVVKKVKSKPKPRTPKGNEEMYIIRCVDALGPKKRAWAVVGPGFWYVSSVKKEIVNIKKQWGITVDVITVKKSTWDKHKRSAEAGMVKVQHGQNEG